MPLAAAMIRIAFVGSEGRARNPGRSERGEAESALKHAATPYRPIYHRFHHLLVPARQVIVRCIRALHKILGGRSRGVNRLSHESKTAHNLKCCQAFSREASLAVAHR